MSEFTFDQIEAQYGRREVMLALPRKSGIDWGITSGKQLAQMQMRNDTVRLTPELLLKAFMLAYPDFEITLSDLHRASPMKLIINHNTATDSFMARVEDDYMSVTFKGKPIEWEKW